MIVLITRYHDLKKKKKTFILLGISLVHFLYIGLHPFDFNKISITY
jgi:hypothetical protein